VGSAHAPKPPQIRRSQSQRRATACRVARGGCPPPALTEPDLWVSHPALRGARGRGTQSLIPASAFPPAAVQVKRELFLGGDKPRLPAVQDLEGQESALREVELAQRVVDRAAVAERPERLVSPVDATPRSGWSCPQTNETSYDEALALPLPKQDGAQAPSEMSIRVAKNADNFRCHATDPEEADPSSEVPVRSRDTADERLPPLARREPPDLVRQAVDRSLRRQHLDFGGLPVTTETKADEVPFLCVATGLPGYQFHREHRVPGDHP